MRDGDTSQQRRSAVLRVQRDQGAGWSRVGGHRRMAKEECRLEESGSRRTPSSGSGGPKDKPWKDAIEEVLREADEPMTYVEIAGEIQRRGLRKAVGATPHRTVNVVLHQNPGAFTKVARGLFTLREASAGETGPLVPAALDSAVDAAEDVVNQTGGIIRAFGMYWRRSLVHWSASPRLYGIQQQGATRVDFAEQKGVYLLYDGREVIYVGRATERRLGARLLAHTKDRLNSRWDRFSWFGLLDVDSDGRLSSPQHRAPTEEDIVTTLEALLIEGLEPRQNRKRGDAFGAVEYLQFEDPHAEKARMLEAVNRFVLESR